MIQSFFLSNLMNYIIARSNKFWQIKILKAAIAFPIVVSVFLVKVYKAAVKLNGR